MVAEIYLHDRKLESIFELLGSKENDITYNIGWVLSQCPSFLRVFLSNFDFGPSLGELAEIEVKLQDHKRETGITDIEISAGTKLHLIIEAKRGLQLPSGKQLGRYAKRLAERNCENQALIAMAECPPEYAKCHLPQGKIDGISLYYFSWKDIHQMATQSHGAHAENRMLGQLQTYLRRIVAMQNQESNLVYVVALGTGTPEGFNISWQRIVTEKRRYFHPATGEGKWPKEPPNYIAFRYGGHLQSIHHVDSWKIVENMHAEIPEILAAKWEPHYLYELGPAIVPSQAVKTGNIFRNARTWAMLDLLLTCDSISGAAELTRKRRSEQN